MLHLKDKNKKKIAGLVDYKDLCIESELQSGDKTLCFSYPKKSKYYFDIEEECYINTKENEFIVKEKNVGSEYTTFKCVLNLEDLEGKPWERYESVEQPIDKALALALAGTGWIVGKCSLKKKRTVRKSNCSSLEVIKEIKKTYRCDLVFNTLTKTIDVYEHLGEDKGAYFIDSLNLKELSIQGNSYEYYTRIIPIGKDNLRISSINGGKDYVENYQYSNKVKTVYWKDDRYTIVENLKEDAEAKLDEISKPYRTYVADIINLAKLSDNYKNILDYQLGDTITLISKDNKFRDKQRIVKIKEYPDAHELDSVELSNTTLSFEEIQTQFQEAADTVDNITTDNGTINGETIDGIKTNQISDFEASVAKIVDLTVINAKIENLEAYNVNITGQLTAVQATIGTLTANVASIDRLVVKHSAYIDDLQANKASITQLQATNATIQVLEANVGKIETLVNGNLSSENIQAGGITSDKLTIANGFITNAMIANLDVSKVNAGDISTNKFRIKSDDGGIEIVGATQQFKDKNNKVRIQMGKDTQGNFNFIIRGEDGTSTLIDHTGVKEKAISDDLIKSNMIASDAVGEKQIDYNSFSKGFNKDTNTTTLKATKIKLDNQNQTLDIAFDQLKTQSDKTKSVTESHSTTIGVMQGQISTAINNTQIVKDGQTILLKDDYNRTVATVDSMKSTIGKHTTQINSATGKIDNVETKVNTVERDLNSITARVSSTETNITTIRDTANNALNKIDNLQIGGRNLINNMYFYEDEFLNAGVKETVYKNKKCLKFAHNAVYNNGGKTQIFKKITFKENTQYVLQVEWANDIKEGKGAKIYVEYTDGSNSYIDNYQGDNEYHYVSIVTDKGKTVKKLYMSYWYGGYTYLAHIKLEEGNKATDWTPAPEDIQNEITTTNNKVSSIETNLSSITSRVSSVETTTVNINGQISNLSTRMNTAETKITDASIISTVSSQFYKKGETDSKYASQTQISQLDAKINLKASRNNIVSEINMSPELIKINTAKLDLTGDLDLTGTFKCYKDNSNKLGAYLLQSGAVHRGYLRSGGNPVFSSGIWRPDGINDMGYVSVGWTNSDTVDGSGCLWMSPQVGGGGELIYGQLVNNALKLSGIRYNGDGSVHYYSFLNNKETTAPSHKFDGGISAYKIHCSEIACDGNIATNRTIYTNTDTLYLTAGGYNNPRNISIDASGVLQSSSETLQLYSNSRYTGGIVVNGAKGYFYPSNDNNMACGAWSNKWTEVIAVKGTISTSDRNAKTNIQYLGKNTYSPFMSFFAVPPDFLTELDLYNFIKHDLNLATFDYKGDIIGGVNTNKQLGFIAQDIENTKIGSMITVKDNNGHLNFITNTYTNVIAGALKVAIQEIELLKEMLNKVKAN